MSGTLRVSTRRCAICRGGLRLVINTDGQHSVCCTAHVEHHAHQFGDGVGDDEAREHWAHLPWCYGPDYDAARTTLRVP